MLLDGVSQSRLERLDRALQAHYLQQGTVPKTLEQLVETSLIDRSYLKDPWARPYHYVPAEAAYVLNAVDDRGTEVQGTRIERSLAAAANR
jgi:predicted transcriptional regulator